MPSCPWLLSNEQRTHTDASLGALRLSSIQTGAAKTLGQGVAAQSREILSLIDGFLAKANQPGAPKKLGSTPTEKFSQ